MGRAFWGARGVSCLGMGLTLRVASQRAQPRSLRGGKATRGCLQILETGSKIWRGLRGAPRAWSRRERPNNLTPDTRSCEL